MATERIKVKTTKHRPLLCAMTMEAAGDLAVSRLKWWQIIRARRMRKLVRDAIAMVQRDGEPINPTDEAWNKTVERFAQTIERATADGSTPSLTPSELDSAASKNAVSDLKRAGLSADVFVMKK